MVASLGLPSHRDDISLGVDLFDLVLGIKIDFILVRGHPRNMLIESEYLQDPMKGSVSLNFKDRLFYIHINKLLIGRDGKVSDFLKVKDRPIGIFEVGTTFEVVFRLGQCLCGC